MQEFSIYLCIRNAQEEQSPRPLGWNPRTPQELPVHFQIDAAPRLTARDIGSFVILSGAFCREGPLYFWLRSLLSHLLDGCHWFTLISVHHRARDQRQPNLNR